MHAELATATKLFSASPNRFGDEPNTNIDPVTLGLPGALPVLNRQAVELAMRIGLALNCRIQACSFHRKNYFYPDMPKAYQISQYDVPLNVDGWLDLPDGTRIGIERAHLEEDTGKSTHVGGAGGRIHGSDASLIDFNRAGVPLVEIVGRPDIRTAEQARQYVTELRAILVAVGASDAKMEEGSMRVDANVSVHKPGEPFGTRCEIKNLNSVRSLGRAIEYEARRQIDLIEAGETRPPGDPPLGRGRRPHAHAALEGGRRRLPVLPRARPRAARPRRRVDRAGAGRRCRRCRPPAAPRSPRPPVRPSTARPSRVVVERGQDGYVLAVAAAGGDAARALVHVKEAYAEQGAEPAVPAADLAALTTLEIVRRADRDAGQAGARRARRRRRRRRRGDRRGQGLRGDGRPARSRRSSTTPSPPTPAAWEKYRGRRGQGGRRPRRRGHEGVARPGRRRRRHGDPAQPARLSRPRARRARSSSRRAPTAVAARAGPSVAVPLRSRPESVPGGRCRRCAPTCGRSTPRRGRASRCPSTWGTTLDSRGAVVAQSVTSTTRSGPSASARDRPTTTHPPIGHADQHLLLAVGSDVRAHAGHHRPQLLVRLQQRRAGVLLLDSRSATRQCSGQRSRSAANRAPAPMPTPFQCGTAASIGLRRRSDS